MTVTPSKPIKEISAEQLKKHKPIDILAFTKQGNLPMVHGLINHFGLNQTAMLIHGLNEDFTTFGK
jgi:hypothetical protein